MSLQCFKDRNTVSALVVGAGFLLYFIYRRLRTAPIRAPAGAVAVGTVKELLIYPIKSVVAMPSVDRARAAKEGLVTDTNDSIRDRAWMIVSDTGVFVSQRAEPKLAYLRVTVPYGSDMVHLAAPDGRTLKLNKYLSSRTAKVVDVSVWGHHMGAVDCGQGAADWVSTYLGRVGFRVVYLPHDMAARNVTDSKRPDDSVFEKDDKTIFSDAAPILILSENSVKDVDEHIEGTPIGVRNFRPNILVSGVAPWDEDTWDEIYIGQVKMSNKRRCDRCLMTTVDPDKGEKNGNNEPIKTLREYRPATGTSPYVGIYTNVIKEGSMRVGDTVYVTRKSS